MISFLAVPAFTSCLFKSSSFRATPCVWSLFNRSFRIPGWPELSYTHVSNPGSHFVMAMRKTKDREGFPKDVKLEDMTDG